MLVVHLLDDFVVKTFSDDDACLGDLLIEQLLLQSCREDTKDVACSKVHPGRILFGLFEHGLSVKGRKGVSLLLPDFFCLQTFIGEFHGGTPFTWWDEVGGRRSWSPV